MTTKKSPRNNEALKHAWDWFDFHAKQRMQTINFYIILVGAILAGVVTAVKDKQYVVSGALGLILVLSSILFFAMDRRARVLVRVGEAALRREEALLARETGNDALVLVEASDLSSKGALTYGRIFYIVFWAMGVIGMALVLWSCVAYSNALATSGIEVSVSER